MDESRPAPPGLGPRGEDLWTRITRAAALDDAGEALLEEACRTLDRCERLHWLISGDADAWATLVPDPEDGTQLTLHIGQVLVEARQQQQTLRALLGQLKLGRVATETKTQGGGLDDLASRRARRGAAPPSSLGTPGGEF